MLDRMYSAEIPSITPNAVYTAAAPTGRIATKGPSQVFGSVKVVMLLGRVIPASDLHATPYAIQKLKSRVLINVKRHTAHYSVRTSAEVLCRFVLDDQELQHTILARQE